MGRVRLVPRRRRLAVVPSLVLVAAVLGCTDGERPADVAEQDSNGNSRYYSTYLEEAVAAEAAPAQIEALEHAVDTGVLSFEAVNELTRQTFQCFTENGISYDERAPHELGVGYYIPEYSISLEVEGRTAEEVTDLADACVNDHSFWASMALQDERVVADARDARLRRDRPKVVECLRSQGVAVADDATLDEIRRALHDLYLEGTTGAESSDVACYDDF